MKKLIVAKVRILLRREQIRENGGGRSALAKKCGSLGELIHNADVVNELASRGLRLIESPADASGRKVLIRAHGIARSVQQELERWRGDRRRDLPEGEAYPQYRHEATAEGRFVIIIGMRRHPEVEGICGWCGEHMVV